MEDFFVGRSLKNTLYYRLKTFEKVKYWKIKRHCVQESAIILGINLAHTTRLDTTKVKGQLIQGQG